LSLCADADALIASADFSEQIQIAPAARSASVLRVQGIFFFQADDLVEIVEGHQPVEDRQGRTVAPQRGVDLGEGFRHRIKRCERPDHQVEPRSFNSCGLISGVTPRSSMLATSGPGTRRAISFISSFDSGASMKTASAPADLKARPRLIASLKPSAWRESVRATMKKSLSFLASTAARSFFNCSSSGITCLPFIWPQRLGQTWSSRNMPAAPARIKSSTVRMTLIALP